MLTLILLAFACWLFGLNKEGTCKSKSILASCIVLKIGRLGVSVWSYRPERVYYRFSLTGG